MEGFVPSCEEAKPRRSAASPAEALPIGEELTDTNYLSRSAVAHGEEGWSVLPT